MFVDETIIAHYEKVYRLHGRGMRQKEIAEQMGITQQGVSRKLKALKARFPELFSKVRITGPAKVFAYDSARDDSQVRQQF